MNKSVPNILSTATNLAAFSKEYKADTEEELTRKLQEAKTRTLEHLASLPIIPIKIDISQDDQIYQLKNGKFAVKIHFSVDYRILQNLTFEEMDSIHPAIHSEQHHLKHLGDKVFPRPHCLKNKRYIKHFGELPIPDISNLENDSLEGLIDALKSAVFDNLNENDQEDKFSTQVILRNLSFYQTSTGKYGASYRLYHTLAERTHNWSEPNKTDKPNKEDNGVEL